MKSPGLSACCPTCGNTIVLVRTDRTFMLKPGGRRRRKPRRTVSYDGRCLGCEKAYSMQEYDSLPMIGLAGAS